MKAAIITALLLCSQVFAGDDYVLVDRANGTTNGPFEITPYADIVIAGRTYTLQPTVVPLKMESLIVPFVEFRDIPARTAIDTLLASGLTNAGSPHIVLFEQDKMTNRVTLGAHDIRLGELLSLICSACDLRLVRDRAAQVAVLVPSAVADDLVVKVYGVSSEFYDECLKSHGSFNRFLVEVGVIRREADMVCEYHRNLGTIVLGGSPAAIQRLEGRFTILRLQVSGGQQTNAPYSSPAAGSKR